MRRRLLVSIATIVTMLAGLLVVRPLTAGPVDPAAAEVVQGLLAMSRTVASASTFPSVSTDLPLTDTSVRDALDLDTRLGRAIVDGVTGRNPTLATFDEIFSAGDELVMVEATPAVGSPAGTREWDATIDLSSAGPVALSYEDERVRFGAGELAGELAASLTGTMRLRYDPSALPLRRFSIVGNSSLRTRAWTRPNGSGSTSGRSVGIDTFSVIDGFVELAARGTAVIDVSTPIRMRDPNGRGLLTTEDLQLGTPEELLVLNGPVPGAEDRLSMALDLRAPILDADPHGTIRAEGWGPDAAHPFAAPQVTRDAALTRLTSLNRMQAMVGFSGFVGAIRSAESAVDVDLPLLDATLTDLHSPAGVLQGIITEQAAATIVCGAADTLPPTGAVRPGRVQYCQARTSGVAVDESRPVSWSSPEPGVRFSGNSAGTVGREPTANVMVSGGSGFPRLLVSFTDRNGMAIRARSTIVSVQQLAAVVDEYGLGGELAYRPLTGSIEIAMRQEQPDLDNQPVAFGSTPSLAQATGLTGLCQALSSASPRRCPRVSAGVDPVPARGATIDARGRVFQATMGMGLVPEPAVVGATSQAPEEPVTYVKPGPDGLLWRIGSIDVDLPDAVPLVARIGFLQVDVDIESHSLGSGGRPAATVTLPTGTVDLYDGAITGAVDVRSLTGGTDGLPRVTPLVERALTASAGLAVAAAAAPDGTRPIEAEATLQVSWTSLAPGVLPAVAASPDYQRLRALDIVPARQGTAGAGSGGNRLVDPGASFTTQFGVNPAGTVAQRTVTRRFTNVDAVRRAGGSATAGARARRLPGTAAVADPSGLCSRFVVIDARTLECTTGPLVDGSGFAPGDRYVMDGDPTALRDVLIEGIAAVLSAYESPDPASGAGATLPLVDLRPDEIRGALDALRSLVLGLQDAATAEVGTSDVSTLQGFASAVGSLVPGMETTLLLRSTGAGSLELGLEFRDDPETLAAPLRIAVDERQLSVLASADPRTIVALPLAASSRTVVDLSVDLADGSVLVGRDTLLAQRVEGFTADAGTIGAGLAGKSAEYGATRERTGEASGIRLGIGLEVRTAPDTTQDWLPLASLRSALRQQRVRVGDAQTCADTDVSGAAACARIPIVDSGSALLTTIDVSLLADQSSGGDGGALDSQPIAYRFLADGLVGLARTLRSALDGDKAGMNLPLVGADLDGGADVPEAVDSYAAAARRALSALSISQSETRESLETKLAGAITGAASSGITVTVRPAVTRCGVVACAGGALVSSVDELQLPITIASRPATDDAPFVSGLPGLSLLSAEDVETVTSWTMDVTLGIRRGAGPFLLMKPAQGATSVRLLQHSIITRLPEYRADSCHSWARIGRSNNDARRAGSVPTDGAPGSRCIDALVGKFPSVLVARTQGDDESEVGRTGVEATITVSATPGSSGAADAQGRVYLPALFDGDLPTSTVADGDGGLDLYFESFASQIGFIDVLGTLRANWSDGTWAEAGAEFDHLQLDAETVYRVLDVGYAKAAKYLAWFTPVMDFLTYRVPVVSDLAELMDQPAVTPLSLLSRAANEAYGTRAGTAFELITRIAEFQQLIASLTPGGKDAVELVNLADLEGGSFSMPARTLQYNSCTKTAYEKGRSGKTVTGVVRDMGVTGRCEPRLGEYKRQYFNGEKIADATYDKELKSQLTKSVYFDLPSVSVPVLEDPTLVYDMLLDSGDATLLAVDLGSLGAKAGYEQVIGTFFIGPVPITATFGAELDLKGRFAFGFDTTALSSKLAELDEPGAVDDLSTTDRAAVFSEGFYIDDQQDGEDVPEITLTGTLSTAAAVSYLLAEAGLRGGVQVDLSIDAFDPDKDGKIYTTEFVGSPDNPDCVFDVSSGIEFFLSFFLWLKLALIEWEAEWDIVRSPRIELFSYECTLPDPVLAVREGDDLRLTMGEDAKDRKAFSGVTDEKYIVRQMGTDEFGNVTVAVSAFNLTQTYVLPPKGRILADAGSGADSITMADGLLVGVADDGTITLTPVPFTLDAVLDGGDGPDRISTERGDDSVSGGAGNDQIRTGEGDDRVDGGAGDDSVDAGIGNDTIDGSDGADRLSGGTGPDLLRGGSGDDLLQGAPGLSWDQLLPTDDPALIGRLLDSGDAIVGGSGSDRVEGGDGSDLVVGGSFDGAVAFDATASARVFAVATLSGTIVELQVPLQTVRLPGLDVVLAQCALGGPAVGTERDLVSGGNQRDFVLGGGGVDDLAGGGGDDLVCGRAGDDEVVGDGADVEESRQGDDDVRGGPGADRVLGDGGNDVLRGDAGDDLLRGGAGGDTLDGGSGADALLGEGGPDLLVGDRMEGDEPTADDDAGGDARSMLCRSETTFVAGGIDLNGDLSSNDLDTGRVEGLTVVGGVLLDRSGAPFTGVLAGTVFRLGRADVDGSGSTGDDPREAIPGDTAVASLAAVFGASGDGDCLLGGAGDDVLRGDEGGDFVDGGAGDDSLRGGGGRDFLRGRDGSDVVAGDAGGDLLAGDSGDDLVVGGRGADVVRGGSGDDRLVGGSAVADAADGRDELLGDGGNDVLAGGNATIGSVAVALTDVIPGRTVELLATPASSVPALEYDDQLFGGFGDDWAFGQGGNDLVRGGAGTDQIEGGPGADVVQGDDGADLVIGGSSTASRLTSDRSGEGVPDEGDVLFGDGGVDDLDGNDVVVGDNARLSVAGGGTRIVQLFGLQVAGQLRPAVAVVGGGDRLDGGGGNDVLLGQVGDDVVSGGAGDDVMEGGAGRDELRGGAGQDDLVGGGSANDGLLCVSTGGRILPRIGGEPSAAGLLDDDDALSGDDGADVMLGDNGRILRTPGGESETRALRTVRMSDPTPGATSGSDRLEGGAGDDDLYGQLDDTGDGGGQVFNGVPAAGDVLIGGLGDDALVGDLGINVPTRAADLGTPNGVLSLNSGFVREVVRRSGTLVNVVTSVEPAVGGDDVLLGGSGSDALHAGAGADLANGGDGDDVVFGALGVDALWGGTGHDLLFGGAGADLLDLKRRVEDSPLVRVVAPIVDMDRDRATVNDNDTVYGGAGPDILQADSGDNGRGPGDRLIDWTGPFNRYLVCGTGMGAPKVQVSPDPAMARFLADLALAVGSVGPDELALPTTQETGPSFGGGPAQASCEG